MSSLPDVCCKGCIPSNKAIQFSIETYKDRVINFNSNRAYQFSSHSYNCNYKQIALYDRKLSELSIDTDKLWGLFNGTRQYRASGHALRFFMDLGDGFEWNDCHGFLVSEIYTHFIARKHKLDDDLVNDLNVFFECYQYGDIIGQNDDNVYLIGLSDISDSNKVNGLRFIRLECDANCNLGLPLEFADAPRNYFIQIDAQFQLIDPLRLTFPNDISWYADLEDEIEKIKNHESIGHCYLHGDEIDEIKVDKFPNQYIAIYSDKFEWISRHFFDMDDFDDVLSCHGFRSWMKMYDRELIETRQRVQEYFRKNYSDSDILKIIIAFII
eukprot:372644_1